MPQSDSFEVGNGGWCRWLDPGLDNPVFLRFTDNNGRLETFDLYLPATRRLDANVLRRIPLGRLEQWVNASPLLSSLIRDQIVAPAPDLRTAVAYFKTTFGSAAPQTWVRDMLWSQLPAWSGPIPDPKDISVPERTKRQPLDRRRLRLDVPESRPFGDDFYKQVADAYRAASIAGIRGPAGAIADENGVTVSQVHRWVKVARERRFLDPGRIGKA